MAHENDKSDPHEAFVETQAPPEGEPEAPTEPAEAAREVATVPAQARHMVGPTLPLAGTDDLLREPPRGPTVESTAFAGPRPGALLHQYELIRELGRGGMGAVFLARDTRLARRVAIKFLAHESLALAERFLSEARATARCKHDSIVDIHDVGEADGHSYMVLEYLQGQTLRTWIDESWQAGGRVSAAQAVELMVPVVDALAHAHGLGLVHRDLKPDNVMLTDAGAIKVLDFGIARIRDMTRDGSLLVPLRDPSGDGSPRSHAHTQAGALMGTLPYMAPEQLRGEEVDVRADIWAVGIMLWELCTGRHPLAPLSAVRLEDMAQSPAPMPSIAEQRADLGPLAEVVDHCLEKERSARMGSTAALLDALQPLLPGRGAGESAATVDNPYVGLAAFQEADSARFLRGARARGAGRARSCCSWTSSRSCTP